MSTITTYSRMAGFQTVTPANDPQWQLYQQANTSGAAAAFQRVPTGGRLDPGKDTVVLTNSGRGASEADMQLHDLLSLAQFGIVDALNEFLEKHKSKYGGFTYVSDAAGKLKALGFKNPNKAAEFRGLLDAFSQEQGFDVRAFDEWDHVMRAWHRGNTAAHPIKMGGKDLQYLKRQAADSTSKIAPYCHAVMALVSAAEKVKWEEEEEAV